VPGGSFEFVALDLADLQSVRDAAAALRSTHPRVDILVNNAGLMALDEQRTAQGFEMQFGVNHLGHVALTFELLPHLASSGRVVTVSSMGHRMGKMHFDDLNAARGYDRWTAYFQSKLANLLFGLELQRRLTAAGSEVQSLVAHPGGTRTDLGTEGSGLTNTMMRKVVPLVTQSVGAGALPIVRACVDRALPGGTFVGCRFMAVGRPVVETPSKRARSEADAQRLWTMSEQLIGATSPV
jgi:NAD(P)-dependent dehydrogenase (short-subunit alcohol dehydrogenase family)